MCSTSAAAKAPRSSSNANTAVAGTNSLLCIGLVALAAGHGTTCADARTSRSEPTCTGVPAWPSPALAVAHAGGATDCGGGAAAVCTVMDGAPSRSSSFDSVTSGTAPLPVVDAVAALDDPLSAAAGVWLRTTAAAAACKMLAPAADKPIAGADDAPLLALEAALAVAVGVVEADTSLAGAKAAEKPCARAARGTAAIGTPNSIARVRNLGYKLSAPSATAALEPARSAATARCMAAARVAASHLGSAASCAQAVSICTTSASTPITASGSAQKRRAAAPAAAVAVGAVVLAAGDGDAGAAWPPQMRYTADANSVLPPAAATNGSDPVGRPPWNRGGT